MGIARVRFHLLIVSIAAILQDVKRDLAQVKSMHLVATHSDDGATSTLTADVLASGPKDVEIVDGASKVRMLLLPAAVYVKGSRAYWEANGGPALADKLSGRWVKAPPQAGKALEPLVGSFAPRRLAACIDVGVGTLSMKGTKTVDGRQVVVVQDAGDKPGAAPGLLYVTTATPRLPVRSVITGARKPGGTIDRRCAPEGSEAIDNGEVVFSQFDAVPEITAPDGAIDLQDLAAQNAGSSA